MFLLDRSAVFGSDFSGEEMAFGLFLFGRAMVSWYLLFGVGVRFGLISLGGGAVFRSDLLGKISVVRFAFGLVRKLFPSVFVGYWSAVQCFGLCWGDVFGSFLLGVGVVCFFLTKG